MNNCVRKSRCEKYFNINKSITVIKFLAWATICYVQSGVIKEKNYKRSLTLPNPGHWYYILYLFIIYIHRYIKYARALARHRRRRGDFFCRYSGQVGRGSGRTGQGIALGHKGARYSGIPWQRPSSSEEKNGGRPEIYTYTHDSHIENKKISRPPPPPLMVYI